jgi:hypothetical protein
MISQWNHIEHNTYWEKIIDIVNPKMKITRRMQPCMLNKSQNRLETKCRKFDWRQRVMTDTHESKPYNKPQIKTLKPKITK